MGKAEGISPLALYNYLAWKYAWTPKQIDEFIGDLQDLIRLGEIGS